MHQGSMNTKDFSIVVEKTADDERSAGISEEWWHHLRRIIKQSSPRKSWCDAESTETAGPGNSLAC